jgi:hypothetical protein
MFWCIYVFSVETGAFPEGCTKYAATYRESYYISVLFNGLVFDGSYLQRYGTVT